MRARTIRKLAVLVTGAALAASLPVASSFADQGGTPNAHSKACPTKAKGKGPKKSAHNSKGKKCGFQH